MMYKCTGVLVVATDVSEQVRPGGTRAASGQEAGHRLLPVCRRPSTATLELANAALSSHNHRLLRTNADLDSFVYAASHDLKLPVLNLLFELRRGVTLPTDPAEERHPGAAASG
jgi:hypothetical protein